MSFPIVAQSSVVILQESRRGEYSKTLYTILLFCLDSLQWKKRRENNVMFIMNDTKTLTTSS